MAWKRKRKNRDSTRRVANSRLGLRSRIVHPDLEVLLVDPLLDGEVDAVGWKQGRTVSEEEDETRGKEERNERESSSSEKNVQRPSVISVFLSMKENPTFEEERYKFSPDLDRTGAEDDSPVSRQQNLFGRSNETRLSGRLRVEDLSSESVGGDHDDETF